MATNRVQLKLFIERECGKPPCYGCQNRSETCHGKCESFLEWSNRHRKLQEEYREKRYIERQADYRRKYAAYRYYKSVREGSYKKADR